MLSELTEEVIAFRDARDWEQYHSPENLAKSICIEAAELLECFQWQVHVKFVKKWMENVEQKMENMKVG